MFRGGWVEVVGDGAEGGMAFFGVQHGWWIGWLLMENKVSMQVMRCVLFLILLSFYFLPDHVIRRHSAFANMCEAVYNCIRIGLPSYTTVGWVHFIIP